MKFVHFTAPDGERVPINPNLVADVKDNDGTWDPRARALILLPGSSQAVRETKAEVMKTLEEA